MSLCQTAITPAEIARLRAASAPHSGDWRHVIPIASIGLKLSDNDLCIAIGYRLGSRICQPFRCICGVPMDDKGLHALSCRKSSARHVRHSQLNDVIRRALNRAQIPATKEPNGLDRTDNKRPDGTTLIPWSHGLAMAWDVTVPDTYAASHISSTSSTPAAAAEQAATGKIAKYSNISGTHQFIPIAIETGGSWCQAAIRFISELGRRTVVVTGDPLETAHLFQRLSITLQRGIAFNMSLNGGEFLPSEP